MPSEKIKGVLGMFRNHFQQEEADIPLSLRQESPDIVFTALLEDPPTPQDRMPPMMGFDPNEMGMPMGSGQDPAAELQGLLRAAGLPTEGMGFPDPVQALLGGQAAPGGAPQAQPQAQPQAPSPQGGGIPPELAAMMGQ